MKNYLHRNVRSTTTREQSKHNYKWYDSAAWESFANVISLKISDILGDEYSKDFNVTTDENKNITNTVKTHANITCHNFIHTSNFYCTRFE